MFTQEDKKKMLMAGIVIGLSIIGYHILDNFTDTLDFLTMIQSILSPIVVAFVIFYIVNIPMKSVERVFFKKSKWGPKVNRSLSLVITLVFFVLFFTVFFIFAVPQLAESIALLINQIPEYAVLVGEFFETQFQALNVSDEIIEAAANVWSDFISSFADIMLSIVNSASSFVSSFITGIFNAVISTALAIYMLLGREQLASIISRLWRAYSPKKLTEPIIKYMDIIDHSFEQFIRGQLMEALILGIICYIGMLIFGFEYALVISFLVGITNVIPIFGPYIGAVPSLLLLLVVNPIHALWFIVYVMALQQVESNLIYPRVVGDAMGISGFWIMVAVIVGNSLFGITGILMGIPLLSSLYVIIKEATDKKIALREAEST